MAAPVYNVSIRLSEDVHGRLMELATANGKNLTETIRYAIECVVYRGDTPPTPWLVPDSLGGPTTRQPAMQAGGQFGSPPINQPAPLPAPPPAQQYFPGPGAWKP